MPCMTYLPVFLALQHSLTPGRGRSLITGRRMNKMQVYSPSSMCLSAQNDDLARSSASVVLKTTLTVSSRFCPCVLFTWWPDRSLVPFTLDPLQHFLEVEASHDACLNWLREGYT